MKQAIRKRSYLLLEIFLSLTLISLCFFPLMKPLFRIKQEEKKMLQTLSSYRELANDYVNVLEKLYQHEISWQELLAGYQKEVNHGESSYTITPLDHKKGDTNEGLLLSIELKRGEKSQRHTLFIEERSS